MQLSKGTAGGFGLKETVSFIYLCGGWRCPPVGKMCGIVYYNVLKREENVGNEGKLRTPCLSCIEIFSAETRGLHGLDLRNG